MAGVILVTRREQEIQWYIEIQRSDVCIGGRTASVSSREVLWQGLGTSIGQDVDRSGECVGPSS